MMMRLLWGGIVAILLCPPVEAGVITSSITSGQCVARSTLPERITWTTTDPTGFVVFAAHDPLAGCAETITNPTSGVYSTGINASGFYEAFSLASWVPMCGRVQIDVQGYTANGLDPHALHTVLIDTGVDCIQNAGVGPRDGPSVWHPTPVVSGTPPIPTTPVSDSPPTPVPEPGSWVLLTLGLSIMSRRLYFTAKEPTL